MKTIKLPCYGIIIGLNAGGGWIHSDLTQEPSYKLDMEWRAAIDTIESLILAHACAGINVKSPKYLEGIETTIDKLTNELFY